MIKNKATKRQIRPTKEQIEFIELQFRVVGYVKEKVLEHAIKTYKESGKSEFLKQSYFSTDDYFIKSFPGIDCEIKNYAIMDIKDSYKRAWSKQNKFPKLEEGKYTENASFTTRERPFKIDKLNNDRILHVPKVGDVKSTFRKGDIPDGCKVKTITISRKAGKYYASLMYEYETEEVVVKKRKPKILGLDFAMHDLLYISSNDHLFSYYPLVVGDINKLYKKAGRENRRLSKMEKGSNNYNKQRIKKQKIYDKINRKKEYFQYCEVKRILNWCEVNNVTHIAIEDLSIKDMQQNDFQKAFNNQLMRLGWAGFVEKLIRKAAERGIEVTKVNRYFASTKTCSQCGHEQKMELSDRVYICEECGFVGDRDKNAALNIAKEGLRTILDKNKSKNKKRLVK